MQSFEHQWMRRSKWLTQALIVSVTVNVGLFATFISGILKEREGSVALELKPRSDLVETAALTNEQLVRAYSILSFQELQLRLDSKEVVEEGFSKRDLALSCLAAFHHFNLDRALGGVKLQQRRLVFTNQDGGEKIELPLFAALADYQYDAIAHYLKTEKWPFTSQGLFFEIQRSSLPRDPSLLEAFYLTHEFHTALALFSKTGIALEKHRLVQLLAEGEWSALRAFTTEQREQMDFSCAQRRIFLTTYLARNSKVAAELLLEGDMEFALKRLDDTQTLKILDLLKEHTPLFEAFAKGLLGCPRSDVIWKQSAALLYSFSQEPMPEPFDHAVVLSRFLPHRQPETLKTLVKTSSQLASKTVKAEEKAKKIHVIQEGESLWKIAKKYHVSVEALMRCNHLDSEKLRAGKKLEIPLAEVRH